jgi:hypothetical protein
MTDVRGARDEEAHGAGRPEHEGAGHGHEKEVTIFVNARPQMVTSRELTFDQVVAQAFPTGSAGPNTAYTVRWQRGPNDKPSGTLVEGQSVKVKEGMRFDVTATDKS